jgi:RNA polymerase sigma factor (sigma-70 family)
LPDKLTRLTLIQRAKNKRDEETWNEFVGVYKGYLYAVVRNMGIAHHDGEEILQEVFLKVWDKLGDFDYSPQRGRFRYWLCTIARNMVISFIRRQKAELARVDKIVSGERENYLNRISVPETEIMADSEWKNFIANRALDHLRKTFRKKEVEAFTLYVEGNSISEVAEKLGLAENSVYIYKARVQDLLRKEIKRLDQELG